ncbi:hypothetical protein KJ765_03000 [Candidatus Micrarchaeota archaeon]|nr:hypothetical protein [Candidatus Micrarchaeota archaeon]
MKTWLENHSGIAGVLAAALIFAFYFGIITLANSLEHAQQQFSVDWPWIIALAIGFGIQARLHLHLQKQLKERAASAGMVASAGVSGTAMVACCAHHVTDFLPFVGLAGVAGFLFDYREVFLLLGVLSNAAGIAYLLSKHDEFGLSSGFPVQVQRIFGSKERLRMTLVGLAAIFFSYVVRFVLSR